MTYNPHYLIFGLDPIFNLPLNGAQVTYQNVPLGEGHVVVIDPELKRLILHGYREDIVPVREPPFVVFPKCQTR